MDTSLIRSCTYIYYYTKEHLWLCLFKEHKDQFVMFLFAFIIKFKKIVVKNHVNIVFHVFASLDTYRKWIFQIMLQKWCKQWRLHEKLHEVVYHETED